MYILFPSKKRLNLFFEVTVNCTHLVPQKIQRTPNEIKKNGVIDKIRILVKKNDSVRKMIL